MALYMVLSCLLLIPFAYGIPGPIDLVQAVADRARYPEVKGYFRIEANLITMLNPSGTTRSWMPCDLIPGKCDPIITGSIDYETPNNDFGKDSVPYGNYQTLWKGTGVTNVDMNVILSKDVCNHSTRKVNLRIRAVDKDTFRNDDIDHWSCFILTTTGPAADEASAKWSDVKTCSGHDSAHKITYRYRWFFVPKSDCHETAGSSGIIRRNIPLVGK